MDLGEGKRVAGTDDDDNLGEEEEENNTRNDYFTRKGKVKK